MKLTVFSRLIMGYFAIFLITGAVSVYAVLKVHQLSTETSALFNIDERLLDIKKKLSDSVLNQLAYEKKYTIAKDPIFHDQFIFSRNDFVKYLAEAAIIADTLPKQKLLDRVKSSYEQYLTLINEEVDQVIAKPSYAKYEYEQRKEKLVKEILEDLRALEVQSQEDIFARANRLREAAADALKLVIIMLTVAFILALGTSFLITRSITNPLMVLVLKTKDISEGVFEGNLKIASPPEVSELATAFNVMCDRLKRIDAMKSEFFSAMSHELRTPLTAIKQGIGLFQEGVGGAMNDKQQRLLAIISEEVHRLIDMVSSLLDLSKMEAGMMTYNFCREHLPPLIEKVVVEMAPLIEAKRIDVEITPGEKMPPLKLDRERILQALRNLIGNAVKFTPDGGRINIVCSHEDHRVELCVKDTGPGIPKENLHAIFEKFQQPPAKASEWAKGTGLGLAFVKHIITAHGGKVWAESEPGHGSTFTFVLPS